MAASITAMTEVATNSAIYSSLWEIGDAENFSDVIIGFLVKWVGAFVLMYPFALLWYAVWVLPWSIYAYSSGVLSILPSIVAYVTSVVAMAAPLAVLVGGLLLVGRHAAAQHRMRQHPHTH